MSTWNSPPQVPNPPKAPMGDMNLEFLGTLHGYVKSLANVISALRNDLEWMLNGNLDVKNIRAKGIKAQSIDVDKLSAISADLGEITAGIIRGIEIYGTYIATKEGTYPRSFMNDNDDTMGVESSPTKSVKMSSTTGTADPQLAFNNNGLSSGVIGQSDGMFLISFGKIELNAPNGINFLSRANFEDWTELYAQTPNETLASALSGKASAISVGTNRINLYNSNGTLLNFADINVSGMSQGPHTHGIPAGSYIKTYDAGGVETGLVQFSAAGGFTYTPIVS